MRAFESYSKNATLALGIAHAEHVRGHLDEGAQWAKRAIAPIDRPPRDTS